MHVFAGKMETHQDTPSEDGAAQGSSCFFHDGDYACSLLCAVLLMHLFFITARNLRLSGLRLEVQRRPLLKADVLAMFMVSFQTLNSAEADSTIAHVPTVKRIELKMNATIGDTNG